jgi:hypothetical protein
MYEKFSKLYALRNVNRLLISTRELSPYKNEWITIIRLCMYIRNYYNNNI